ncbi:MAG: glycosyltransferase family 2 protein [Xanthobacteraceae bacterium]|nr:glycosyltransferase family 2 protein [Xanthobacteraceae bacterium]
MGLISATMIVRDEEHFLPACLASIVDLVDEIVVVDTGSKDRSRDIARDFGARLVDFAWIDDFSAARNVAIEHARFDWMLYIDADERARPIDRTILARELDDPLLLAAKVQFRPRTGFTAYPEHRLIRRDPRIRFHGAMHETFLPDVTGLVEAGLGRIGTTTLTLDHVGYDGDQSHKLDRNLRLLLKQIAATPRRPYLRWHLGSVLHDLGRLDEAEASWREGARLAREMERPTEDAALCAVELAKLAVEAGRDPGEAIADGLKVHPGNWMLRWLGGKALLQRGAFEEARPVFEALAAIDPATLSDNMSYDARIFGAGALQELAEDAFARADYTESAALFGRALTRDPGRLELRAKHALASARAAMATPGA